MDARVTRTQTAEPAGPAVMCARPGDCRSRSQH